MTEQVRELWQRIVGGEIAIDDDVLTGALLVGMLFATVHLVTMLVTRWGDHKATTKALIFSVVAHLSCACGIGLVAMNRTAPLEAPKPGPPPKNESFQFTEVKFDGAETFDTKKSGNTPLFDTLPRPKQVAMTRRELLPLDLQPLPDMKRKTELFRPPDLIEPKLPTIPDRPVSVPQPIDAGQRDQLKLASIPQRIFDETARRRDEVRNPSPLNRRVKLPRPAQTPENVVREMNRGTTDKVEPTPMVHIPIVKDDKVRQPNALLQPGPEKPTVQRRVAPARSIVTSNDTGFNARRKTPGTAGTNPQPNPFERLRTRPIDGVPDGGVERLRPNVAASQPRPADRRLASRVGPKFDTVRSGPQPNVVTPTGPVRRKRTQELPATYRLRSLANRKAASRKFGGTDASEKAVENALRWLARNQHRDGYWDASAHGAGKIRVDEQGVNRRYAGRHADAGLTALSLLAFLGAGYTHEDGPYAKTVDKAIDWLISQQTEDGFLGGKATHYAKMYCHGMATYALAEAYSMQSDKTTDTRIRRPLIKAVKYILDSQNPTDGGWRYMKGQISDMSMFGWQLMGLKSAEIAGVRIPDSSKKLMVKFLLAHSFGVKKGLAAYQKDYPVTATMTAEALFCKQIFRIPRNHPACKEAVDHLMDRLPRRSKLNLYYWYYGTLAMFQYGGPEWKQWNEAVRAALVAEQTATGANAGSWAPRGPWGPYGGRVFSTAMSTMCLEVYYRFLPLYKMSGRGIGKP